MESNPIEFADKLYADYLLITKSELMAKFCCEHALKLLMQEATYRDWEKITLRPSKVTHKRNEMSYLIAINEHLS